MGSYCHVVGQWNMFKLPEGCENIGKSSYLNLPHIGFTLFSPIKGRIDSLTVQPLWLNFHPLPVSRIAWHTCIIPQNGCTCLCVINIYSKTVVFVYCLYKGEDVLSWKTCIWSYCHVVGQWNMFKLPEGCENIGKSSYLNLPHIGFTLFW
jgi:hypothetical protein